MKENHPTVAWPDLPFPTTMRNDWEYFFQRIHPGIVRDGYKSVYPQFFENDLAPLQYMDELRQMVSITRAFHPKTIMEIGCDRCSGFYHWCMIPGVKKMIGSEIRGTPFSDLFERNFPDIEFCWIEDSRRQDGLDKVESFLGKDKLDVLFIDGDKCFYREDFDTYLPVMNPHGLVLMHDVVEGYPKEVFDKLKSEGYRTALIRDTSAYNRFVTFGHPPRTSYEHWLSYWKGTSCGVGVISLGGTT
jgi:hypothetical protein